MSSGDLMSVTSTVGLP